MKDLDSILAALERHETNRATQVDLETLAAFSRQISREIQRARGQKEVELSAQDIQLLLDMATIVSSHRELEDVLRAMTEQAVKYLGVEACAILKWDPEVQTLTRWAVCAPSLEQALPDGERRYGLARFPFARQVLEAGIVAQGRLDDPDLSPAERQFLEEAGLKTLLAMPLVTMRSTVGLITLMDSREARRFTPHEILIGNLIARHAAMTIERATLLEAAERRAAHLEALYQASLSLTASLDLHQVLDAASQLFDRPRLLSHKLLNAY